jgi:Na+-translocating ferredoxin:NAD+ oxidoreductase RnfE subunit
MSSSARRGTRWALWPDRTAIPCIRSAVAAEQRFPVPVVVVHGLVGAVTLVLVLITALTL